MAASSKINTSRTSFLSTHCSSFFMSLHLTTKWPCWAHNPYYLQHDSLTSLSGPLLVFLLGWGTSCRYPSSKHLADSNLSRSYSTWSASTHAMHPPTLIYMFSAIHVTQMCLPPLHINSLLDLHLAFSLAMPSLIKVFVVLTRQLAVSFPPVMSCLTSLLSLWHIHLHRPFSLPPCPTTKPHCFPSSQPRPTVTNQTHPLPSPITDQPASAP